MSKRSESGFAMLLVFAMAAAVALMLYRELPRLVFESQRIKEQDLVARGLQYRRAIQLYVRKNRRYPQSLEDLERGTGIRYLRRRYKDPMTGKDEWRLIHIDNAGVFTDSLIHKPDQKEQAKSQNTFITEGAAFGSTGPAPGQEGHTGGAAVRGASDRPVVTAQQFQGPPGAPPAPFPAAQEGGQAEQPNTGQELEQAQEGEQPSNEFQPPNPYPYQAGLPFGAPANPPNMPPEPVPGQQPVPYPGQQPALLPGQQPVPQPSPQLQFGVAPYVVPAQPNPVRIQPGQPVPYGVATGQQPPAPSAGAPQYAYPYQQQPVGPAPQIGVAPYVVPTAPQPYGRQSVRPGQPIPFGAPAGQYPPAPYPSQGVPGLPGPYGVPPAAAPATTQSPSQAKPGVGQANPALDLINKLLTTPRPGGMQGLQGTAPGGGMIPGGIAGVATSLEAEGIMVFNERTKYNEWEFIYDFRQEQAAAAASAALGAGVGSDRNPLGAQQPSQPSLTGPAQQPPPFGGATLPGPRTRFGAAR